MSDTRKEEPTKEEPEKKERELTPEEKAEEARRLELQEKNRQYYWDNFTHKPGWQRSVWQRSDRQEETPEQTGIAEIRTDLPLSKKIEPAYYDITYVPEHVTFARKIKRFVKAMPEASEAAAAADKKRMDKLRYEQEQELLTEQRHAASKGMSVLIGAVQLQKKMARGVDKLKNLPISLKEWLFTEKPKTVKVHFDGKSYRVVEYCNPVTHKQQFINEWAQVFQGAKRNAGMNEFKLDFPRKKEHPEEIDLNEALLIVKAAEKEKVAIYIEPDSVLYKRLMNPQNKEEEKLSRKILRRAERTQEKVASDPVLSKIKAEMAHANHAIGLKEETKALKEKGDALQKAIPKGEEADILAKIKELDSEKTKVEQRLQAIERDFALAQPPEDVSKKYEDALSAASKVIGEMDALMKSEGLEKVKEKDEYKKLQSAFAELKETAEDLRERAGINALPPANRAEEKIKMLREKLKEFEEAKPEDKEKLLKEISSTIKDINNETDPLKKNTPAEFDQYITALAEAKIKMDEVVLEAEASEEVKDAKAVVDRAIENTRSNIEEMSPTSRMKREEEDIKEIKEEETSEDRLKALNEQFDTMQDELTQIENKTEELNLQLRGENPDIEKIAQGVEELIQGKEAVFDRKERLSGLMAEVGKGAEPEIFQITQEKEKAATEKLNDVAGHLDGLKGKVEEIQNKPSGPSAAPAA